MAENSPLNLVPSLIEHGKFELLVNDGQTVSASLSPLDNSLNIFVTNSTAPQAGHLHETKIEEEQPIYFCSIDAPPSSERRLFITDTLIIFAALQKLLKTAHLKEPDWIQSNQSLTVIRKLAIDYVNFIKECWVHASQPIVRPEGALQYTSDHYRSLYTCFSLFVVLYLPEPGYEQAPVGDELMEWLNIHFIEPSTEEGNQLSALDRPWEDENFWTYLTRTILRGLSKASLFFLGVLAQHPSEDLRQLTSTLTPLIGSQPRLQNFTAERDFAYASRRWNDKVKTLRLEMDRVPEEARYDDFDNWWDRFSDIIGVLEGRPEVLIRVCGELGTDWKEVCAAWSIFVDPRLRRQNLPDVVAQVLDDMPPDPTSLEDMIHAAMFSGQAEGALQHAARLDRWLSAHLADLMEPLSLLELEVDKDTSLTVRDQYILSYAEYLHSDPALWRITIDYMYSCGETGKLRGDEVLLRVPLRLHEQTTDSSAVGQVRAGDVVGALKDVNQACFDYQREAVRRTVCRIAAQSLVQEKEFGLAVSYCASAEDWAGLGRVVDRVLDEYIINGPKTFLQYASAIAPSLKELHSQSAPQGVFVYRLMFAVHYAHFRELLEKQEYQDAASDLVTIFHHDVAPKSWWAVVLCDALPLIQYGPSLLFSSQNATLLLQKVNEIFVRTSQGSGSDYLSILSRIVGGGGQKEAEDKLQIVRLALARYFARCTVQEV